MLVNLEKCLAPLNGAIYRRCHCLQQKYAWSSITFMARAGNLSLSHRRRTIIDHLFSFTNDFLIVSKLRVRTRRHFRYVEENSWGAMGEYSRRNRHNWSADILFPHGCSPHLDTAVEVVGDVRDVCIIGRIGGWDRCIFLSFQFGFCCLRRKLQTPETTTSGGATSVVVEYNKRYKLDTEKKRWWVGCDGNDVGN